MNKFELAENYVNGNHSVVKSELEKLHGIEAAAMAIDIYETLRGQYGTRKEHLAFRGWISKYSPIDTDVITG